MLGVSPLFLSRGGIRFALATDGLPAALKRLAAIFILGDHHKNTLLWQLVLYAQLPLAYQQTARNRPLYGGWLRAFFHFWVLQNAFYA